MSKSKKKLLQKAAIKFRKENPNRHLFYSALISSMARYIIKSGVAEVIVGFKNGEYYQYANKH